LLRSREVQSAEAIVLNWEKNARQWIPSVVAASLGDELDCAAIEFDPSPPSALSLAVRSVSQRRSGAKRFAVAIGAAP
jgi:hypothetical protein